MLYYQGNLAKYQYLARLGIPEIPLMAVPIPTPSDVPTTPLSEWFIANAVQCEQALVGHFYSAINDCNDINSNWACYAEYQVEIDPVEYRFHSVRDRRPLPVINSMTIQPNGAVVMNLDLVGEDLSFLALFYIDGGNIHIIDLNSNPLQCAPLPPGFVLRTDSERKGKITINGIEIRLE